MGVAGWATTVDVGLAGIDGGAVDIDSRGVAGAREVDPLPDADIRWRFEDALRAAESTLC